MNAGPQDKIIEIKKITARIFHIPPPTMDSDSRPEHFSWPRQIAMNLCYLANLGSLEYVGNSFGGRCHSTVLHANRAVKDRITSAPEKYLELYRMCREDVEDTLSVFIPKIEGGETDNPLTALVQRLDRMAARDQIDYSHLVEILEPEKVLEISAMILRFESRILTPLKLNLQKNAPKNQIR